MVMPGPADNTLVNQNGVLYMVPQQKQLAPNSKNVNQGEMTTDPSISALHIGYASENYQTLDNFAP